MKEGYYLAVILNTNGAAAAAQLLVTGKNIIGQNNAMSFYGEINDATMTLNVEVHGIPRDVRLLEEYVAYSFSGYLNTMPDGFSLVLDDHCDIPVAIEFTFIPDLEDA